MFQGFGLLVSLRGLGLLESRNFVFLGGFGLGTYSLRPLRVPGLVWEVQGSGQYIQGLDDGIRCRLVSYSR